MGLPETVMWAITACSLSIAGFFLKQKLDKIDTAVQAHQVTNLEKRLEAVEELMSNLCRDVGREFAELRTEVKWAQKFMEDRLRDRK